MNIKELLKGGQLTKIEVDEVSLVGAPANGRRFLFTKAADMNFAIKTDQTFGGTTISVNGEELEGLESFYLSINDVSKEDQEEWGSIPVSGHWSLKESSQDGVEQRTMFSLQSDEVKKMEKPEVIQTLKSAFEIDITEVDFDKLDAEKQTSLAGFATFAKAMPEQFRKSQATAITAMIAKEEAPSEKPAEKPAEAEGTSTGLTEESVKAMIAAALAEKEKPAEEPKEGGESEPTEVEKAVAKLTVDMAAIAKATGTKLSSETGTEFQKADGKDGWGWGNAELQ